MHKFARAHLKAVVSCCSGGDGCGVEQARQSVLSASVDHHSGCSSWAATTLPAHISTVQGGKLINILNIVKMLPELQHTSRCFYFVGIKKGHCDVTV